MSDLHHPIEPEAAAEVAAALSTVGRTEDLRFSPDGTRLALAAFASGSVVLVDVAIGGTGRPRVALTGVTVLETDLVAPHGLDWLDAHTLVVGDREGTVSLLPVPPPPGPGAHVARATAVALVDPDAVQGPGSVAVATSADGRREVLVCNNWGDTITRHRLDGGRPPAVEAEEVWLRRGLHLPDGVAVSADGRWLAVSVHDQQLVLVYDRGDDAAPDERQPTAVLRGTRFPHGLRFTLDGCHLLVADAGAPEVHVHAAGPDGWATAGHPVGVVRVLDDETFTAHRHRPDEGGPKGLDVDPTGRVLATTTQGRALSLVDLEALLRHPCPPDPEALAAYERAALDRLVTSRADRERALHDALAAEAREHDARALAARTEERALRAEAAAAAAEARALDAEHRAAAEAARADAAEEHLDALRSTRLVRIAAPPRRAYARLRARR